MTTTKRISRIVTMLITVGFALFCLVPFMASAENYTENEKSYEGYYYIRTSLANNKYVSGNTKKNSLQLWSKGKNSTGQIFYLQYASDSYEEYYVLIHNASHKAVTLSGDKLSLADYTGAENQLWEIEANSNGTVTFFNVSNGDVIDICGADTKNGTAIIPWGHHGDPNQCFYLEPVSGDNNNTNIASAVWSLKTEKIETATANPNSSIRNETRFYFANQQVPSSSKRYLTKVYFMDEEAVLNEIENGDFPDVASMKKFVKMARSGQKKGAVNKLIKKEYTSFNVTYEGNVYYITATTSYEYEVWNSQAELRIPDGYSKDDGTWEVKT